jgi:hypothetical protein
LSHTSSPPALFLLGLDISNTILILATLTTNYILCPLIQGFQKGNSDVCYCNSYFPGIYISKKQHNVSCTIKIAMR